MKLDYWTDDKEKLRANIIYNIQMNILKKVKNAVEAQFVEIEEEYVKGNLRTITQITQQMKNQLKQSFEFNQRNAANIDAIREQIHQINLQNNEVRTDLMQIQEQFQ